MSSTRLIQCLQGQQLRVFTTRDMAQLLAVSITAASRMLKRLTNENIVVRLKQGIWVNLLNEQFRIEEALPYLTAPWPSYVSLYSALAEHGWIQEIPQQVYGVTGGRPFKLYTPLGVFNVRHIPPTCMWGFALQRTGRCAFPLASGEKALLDLVYLAGVPRAKLHIPTFREIPPYDEKKLMQYARRWAHPFLKAFVRRFCSTHEIDARLARRIEQARQHYRRSGGIRINL